MCVVMCNSTCNSIYIDIHRRKEVIHMLEVKEKKISKQGERFIRYYSLYMGKLEGLETNMFHLGDAKIFMRSIDKWSNVKPKDLANWYDEAFNEYIDVDNKEIEENRYEWMLNNLSERIGVCITKIKVLEDK